jgi:hypothetical protein
MSTVASCASLDPCKEKSEVCCDWAKGSGETDDKGPDGLLSYCCPSGQVCGGHGTCNAGSGASSRDDATTIGLILLAVIAAAVIATCIGALCYRRYKRQHANEPAHSGAVAAYTDGSGPPHEVGAHRAPPYANVVMDSSHTPMDGDMELPEPTTAARPVTAPGLTARPDSRWQTAPPAHHQHSDPMQRGERHPASHVAPRDGISKSPSLQPIPSSAI